MQNMTPKDLLGSGELPPNYLLPPGNDFIKKLFSGIFRNTGLLLVIVSYAYILFVTLGYDSAWTIPEAFGIKYSIIEKMYSETDILWPFKFIFNFDVFEFVPRSTRPLSSLFEIADTFFRVQLWKIITPHASLSLTFIFTLLLNPYCLYRLLKNWDLNDNQAKIAVSFYLLQPGTLSLLSMYFRPAKALSIFFMILSFLVASNIQKRRLIFSEKPSCTKFFWLFMSLIIGFLFDETAAVFYVAFFILFYRFVLSSKKLFLAFASIPVIVAVLYFYIFPSIAGILYSSKPVLSGYIEELFQTNFDLASFQTNFLNNFRALFADSWILFNPDFSSSLIFRALFSAQNFIIALTSIYFLVLIFCRIKSRSFKFIEYKILIQALLVILWGAVAHGLLMSIIVNQVWGPYWYGSYMGVFFVLLIAGLFNIKSRGFDRMVSVAVVSTMIMSMLTFPCLNFVYKKYHYYPSAPLSIQKIFEWKINRFEIDRNSAPTGIRKDVEQIVQINKSGNIPDDIIIIKELLWLPVELCWPQKKQLINLSNGFQWYYRMSKPAS